MTHFQATKESIATLINCPSLPMHDGTMHPAIGFGTYKVGFIPASASSATASVATTTPARTAEECVTDALKAGYRFLECAEFYGNEQEIGKAIANLGLGRQDLFLVSKVWTTTIEKVRRICVNQGTNLSSLSDNPCILKGRRCDKKTIR